MTPSIVGVVAAAGGFFLQRVLHQRQQAELQHGADEILARARSEAEQLKEDAERELRDDTRKRRREIDEEERRHREDMRKRERSVEKKEGQLERQQENLSAKSSKLDEERSRVVVKEKEVEEKSVELDRTLGEQKTKLLELSSLSPDEAREIVLNRFEKECESALADFARKTEELKREQADEISQRVLATALQRNAVQYTAETVTSTIDLPSEELKGRIIGREGRNIRAIEKATGVDVIVDDTPGVIVISCFDAVRREIARKAMERLVQDGRIHPGRVEELVAKTRNEIEEDIRQTGRKVCKDLKLPRIHPQMQYLVGRLKYRTSYGQNVLEHSIEVAYLMAAMASELKLESGLSRRCGLLHDVGKALTHEIEGSHAIIGADQAKRYDEKRVVVNAIGAHHEEMPYESVYAVLTQTADAISAGRPGARRDTIERYIERLEKLEHTATTFDGVQSAFALQAGRELRVLVDADRITDDEALLTAQGIARKIESELTYPGEIKVTLIRERRVTEVAR